MKNINESLKRIKLPKQSDYLSLKPATHNFKVAARKNLWKDGMFTQKYIQLQMTYRFFLSQFFLERTEMARIDRRLSRHEYGFLGNNAEQMNFYQKNDLLGLNYFYLRNHIHIERLGEGQLRLLERLTHENITQQQTAEIKKMIETTYKKVLAFSDDSDFSEIELFPSAYGEGNIAADAIVFVLATAPEYDEKGNIKDNTLKEKKALMLSSLKAQLEMIWSINLKVPVKIILEE